MYNNPSLREVEIEEGSRSIVKSRPTTAVLVAASFWVSGVLQAQHQTSVTETTFAAGCKIMMQLDGGNYTVRPGVDNRIRVTLSGTAFSISRGRGAGSTHSASAWAPAI